MPILLLLTLACSRAPEPLPWNEAFRSARAAAWNGPEIVQLTDDGRVLARSRDTLQVVREVLPKGAATGLADGKDGPLVALASGDVAYLRDGQQVPALDVDGEVRWMGTDGKDDVVVTVEGASLPDRRWRVYTVRAGLVATFAPPDHVFETTISGYVRGQRLLVGWNQGEWGGALVELDLATGTVKEEAPAKLEPVYGFASTPDGVVAHGGMDHGSSSSWVYDVDADKALYHERLWDRPLAPSRPYLPIGHLLVGETDVITLTLGQMWRSDLRFASWEHVGDVALDGQAGRPDALGYYGAIRAAHREPDGTLLFATSLDGVVAVQPDGSVTRDPPVPWFTP